MRRKALFATVVVAFTALILAAGWAEANHIRIDLAPPTPDGPALVVPETLQADQIMAHQVRAHTIYANTIDTDQIQGLIYQTAGVQLHERHGEIKASEISASVIYADKIRADSVVADAVYVRDLRLE